MRMVRVVSLLAVGLLAAACDDGDDSPAKVAPRSSNGPSSSVSAISDSAGEDPAAAYQGWLDALQAKDAAEACARQAPDFTIQLRLDAILVDRAELGDPCVGFEALLWEDPDRNYDPTSVTITLAFAEKATLAAEFDGPGETDETVEMVYHRARWRVLSETDRDESADGEGGVSSDAQDGPARWLDRWCELEPTMTREEIVDLMGEPSGEYTVDNGGEPQLWWARDQYDFRAYLDVDGSVLELIGDYDRLTADEQEQLSCAELRN